MEDKKEIRKKKKGEDKKRTGKKKKERGKKMETKKIRKKIKGKRKNKEERKEEGREGNAHLQQIFYKWAFGGTVSLCEMFLDGQIWFGLFLPFPHYCCSAVTFTIVSAMQQFRSFCYLASCKKKEG